MSYQKILTHLNRKKARFVRVPNDLWKVTGSATSAYFLALAMYLGSLKVSDKRDGWFYKSNTEWEEDIGLTRGEQRAAIKKLTEKGLIKTKVEGCPPTTWFLVDYVRVLECLRNLDESK